MTELENRMYEVICRHDGIKAREIARETGSEKTELNRLLYCAPFIRELCYRDDDYRWHGLIRQMRPHHGLGDVLFFCLESGENQRRMLTFKQLPGTIDNGFL